jgi:hypothetical protein
LFSLPFFAIISLSQGAYENTIVAGMVLLFAAVSWRLYLVIFLFSWAVIQQRA